MTVAKVFRALQSEPFNKSVEDIKRMTIPMVRNLLSTLSEPEGQPATLDEVQKLLGPGAARPARR